MYIDVEYHNMHTNNAPYINQLHVCLCAYAPKAFGSQFVFVILSIILYSVHVHLKHQFLEVAITNHASRLVCRNDPEIKWQLIAINVLRVHFSNSAVDGLHIKEADRQHTGVCPLLSNPFITAIRVF